VIISTENRGRVDQFKEVVRRAARAGFVAIAPDLLSRQGGIQQFPEAAQQSAALDARLAKETRP